MKRKEIKKVFREHLKSLDCLNTEVEVAMFYRLIDATESIVKSLLPVVSRELNATFKKGDEVWYNREKCTVLFIDESKNLLDLEAEDSFIYIGTDVKNVTPVII